MTGLLRRGVLFVLVFFLMAAAIPGITAAGESVGLDCVGHEGGAVYLTDSNLTVYENASGVTFGTFPDDETVEFGEVALSAADNASTRLENATGATTCLGDVDATSATINVTADGAGPVFVDGNAAGLSFRDPVYTPGNDTTDLAYDSADGLTIQVNATGLAAGTAVVAADNDAGTELDRSDVAANGSVALSLSAGTHDVDLIENSGGIVATNDTYSTSGNEMLTENSPGVLDNDPGGEALSVNRTVSGPSHGDLTLHANGSFEYTPDPDFTGEDSFTYEATDGSSTDTASVTINVSEATPPTAEAGRDRDEGIGDTVTFDGSNSSADAGISTYAWDFDDDGTTDETGKTANHTFHESGDHVVRLTVTDAAGNTDTDQITVSVHEESVHITAPRPGEGDIFHRGDVVPVELEFVNTDTATVTFGDRGSGQSIEINVTVRDADGSGTATFYINTFQIGHGYTTDGGQNWEQATTSRNHGFFTLDDGTALVGPDERTALAHNGSLDIRGGSDGGGVVPGLPYDLYAAIGEDPYKVEGATVDDRSIVRLEERGTHEFEIRAAPGTGPNDFEAKTFEDVEAAIDRGHLNPADGAIAERDVLVLDIKTTGLTGLLHEAALQDDEIDGEDLFVRGDDHLVTGAFFAADDAQVNSRDLIDLDLETVQTNEGPNQDPIALDIENETMGVVAGTYDGLNFDQFVVPIALDPGETRVLPSERELRAEQVFSSRFRLAPGTDSPSHSNQPLIDVDADFNTVEDEAATWEYVRAEADVDRDGDELVVPPDADVTITGTTTATAGTNLTVNIVTKPGQNDPFLKPFENVPTTYKNGAPNTWGTTANFSGHEPGTEFEINIVRQGDTKTLPETPVDGVIGESSTVNEFVFEDQHSGGESVVVDTFNSTWGGYIAINNADDERIGWSAFQDSGEHTIIPVSLDEPIEEDQELRAVAYRTENRVYEEDGDPVTRTANISTPDVDPATFLVSNLTPQNAQLEEPGLALEVNASVENVGDETATKSVALQIDDQVVESQNVTLANGESKQVRLEADTGQLDAGQTYVFSVDSGDDNASGTLTVAETNETDGLPEFAVEITDTNAPVTEGETLTVTANVTNTGDGEGTQTITLTDTGFNDTQRDAPDVELAPGESNKSVTLEWPTEVGDAGSGDVTVVSENDTATRSVTVEEADTNDPPNATADSYETDEGSTLTVSASNGVLANDDDPDGDSLSVSLDTDASNGDLTLDANGSFAYTPDDGFTGEDSFTYRIDDGGDNIDTDTVTITVEDVTAPTADAGANRTVNEDTAVSFDGSNSTDNGVIDSYEWEFGDGNTSTGNTTTHTYADPGTYTVTLTVTDDGGNVDTDSLVVTVDDTTAPTADAGSNRTVEEGTQVDVDGSGSTDNAGIVSYAWTFGDGANATGATANHTYSQPGTYIVNLTVTDAAGHTATDALTVTVEVDSSTGSSDDDDDDGDSTDGDQPSFALEDGAGSTDLDAAIGSIEVDFADDGSSGTITVEPSDERPPDADQIPDTSGIAFVDVTVPSGLTDSEATMQLTIDAEALGDIDPDDLVVHHYDDGAWTALETTVVSTSDGQVVIEATTPGFSLFAVGPAAQQDTPDDGTPEDEPTPTPEGSPTPREDTTPDPDTTTPGADGPDDESDSFSGVTLVALLVATILLVALALVAVRRRS